GPLFREHSTPVISPELLAALAQGEGGGKPVARPQCAWRWSRNPFEWYRPSSSAVGMFQITDAAFRDARRYCIHDHAVAEDGPWYDWSSCWFNGLYTRVLPSHAIEMTSALLHRSVVQVLSRHRGAKATLLRMQELAAVIHLCGLARGGGLVRRDFKLRARRRLRAPRFQARRRRALRDAEPARLPPADREPEAALRRARRRGPLITGSRSRRCAATRAASPGWRKRGRTRGFPTG